jgi:predicted nucleotidyltransferase
VTAVFRFSHLHQNEPCAGSTGTALARRRTLVRPPPYESAWSTPPRSNGWRKSPIAILKGHPEIIAAYLYSSAARGEPAADLDIAVLSSGAALDAHALEDLAARLQAEGAPTGPDLDLRLLAGANPRFRANVLREGRLLYAADRDSRLGFEARALSEWLDYKPVWERMRRTMLDRWAHG